MEQKWIPIEEQIPRVCQVKCVSSLLNPFTQFSAI